MKTIKRNKQDATLININALKKRVDVLEKIANNINAILKIQDKKIVKNYQASLDFLAKKNNAKGK